MLYVECFFFKQYTLSQSNVSEICVDTDISNEQARCEGSKKIL